MLSTNNKHAGNIVLIIIILIITIVPNTFGQPEKRGNEQKPKKSILAKVYLVGVLVQHLKCRNNLFPERFPREGGGIELKERLRRNFQYVLTSIYYHLVQVEVKTICCPFSSKAKILSWPCLTSIIKMTFIVAVAVVVYMCKRVSFVISCPDIPWQHFMLHKLCRNPYRV